MNRPRAAGIGRMAHQAPGEQDQQGRQPRRSRPEDAAQQIGDDPAGRTTRGPPDGGGRHHGQREDGRAPARRGGRRFELELTGAASDGPAGSTDAARDAEPDARAAAARRPGSERRAAADASACVPRPPLPALGRAWPPWPAGRRCGRRWSGCRSARATGRPSSRSARVPRVHAEGSATPIDAPKSHSRLPVANAGHAQKATELTASSKAVDTSGPRPVGRVESMSEIPRSVGRWGDLGRGCA